MAQPYKLFYHSVLPGRGEFIRLVLELAGAPYEDVARGPLGNSAVTAAKTNMPGMLHFAPPILQVSDKLSISQTPVVCEYLARKHGLMPDGGEENEYAAIQIDHSVHDIVVEAHATHHPVDVTAAYGDQIVEAKRAAMVFTQKRIPRLFRNLEQNIEIHGDGNGPFLFGTKPCYVDLSIAHVMNGVEYAFPKAFKVMSQNSPRLLALREAVLNLPNIAAYRKSARCIPFNVDGIFRYCPELEE